MPGATDDLKLAWARVRGKRVEYDRLFNYYDGNQPVSYTHERLAEFFRGFRMNFFANWCGVIIDSVLDRLTLIGAAADTELAEAVAPWWIANELDTEARLVHEAALVCGEAFLIVWPDEDGQPEAYFNDPRWVHMQYSGDHPREKAWACKFFEADDGTLRATIYYPERLEYWGTKKKVADASSAAAFSPDPDLPVAPNPHGEVPVFHFRVHARRPRGDLDNVVPLQDAINKLLADMMVAAEFGAFRQRYIISDSETLGKLKNAPNEIWDLPGGAQVGELGSADLANYLAAIEHMISQAGKISSTPGHFFLQAVGANISGEALITLEAPLNAKVLDRVQAFTPPWRRVLRFMARLSGMADVEAIEPQWAPVESIQPLVEAQIVKTFREAGVSLASALRQIGWSEVQITTMEEERMVEELSRRETLGGLYAQAQVDFNRGMVDQEE